jgi:hypothetical protein
MVMLAKYKANVIKLLCSVVSVLLTSCFEEQICMCSKLT